MYIMASKGLFFSYLYFSCVEFISSTGALWLPLTDICSRYKVVCLNAAYHVNVRRRSGCTGAG